MKRSAWLKDNMKIKRLEYIHNKKILPHDSYTLEGHQRALTQQALKMVLRYEQTGVLD